MVAGMLHFSPPGFCGFAFQPAFTGSGLLWLVVARLWVITLFFFYSDLRVTGGRKNSQMSWGAWQQTSSLIEITSKHTSKALNPLPV